MNGIIDPGISAIPQDCKSCGAGMITNYVFYYANTSLLFLLIFTFHMRPFTFQLKNRYIWMLVLAGTLLRFFCGMYAKAWLQSPDQLAWEAELEELLRNGNFSYKQLIHYPHEGGSFFISLLALLLIPFKTIMPALSLAALLIDTAIRFVQIRITQRVFGDRAGWAFAVFSILSLPSLLPWATVNFGLHAISSVFPFLLLYFATSVRAKERSAIYCGLLSGAAISFAFDNIILVPAYLLFLAVTYRQQTHVVRSFFQYAGCTILALLPYLCCRLFIEQSFAFEDPGIFSVRDLSFENPFSAEQASHLYKVWYTSLPASFFLSAVNWLSSRFHTTIVLAFLLPALFIAVRKGSADPPKLLASLLILCFVVIYSLSPVYTASIEHKSYIDYRYMSYLLPFLLALMISSFVSLPKAGVLISYTWISLCAFFSLVYISHLQPAKIALYEPAGWVLAKKYGSEPHKLLQIVQAYDEATQQEMKKGFGWGISTGLLRDEKAPATAAVEKINILYRQFPPSDRQFVREGILFSFDAYVTPRLDPAIFPVLKMKLEAVE
jgi:hypothetical protein